MKFLKGLLAALMLAGSFVVKPLAVSADAVIDELWGKPILAYGASLTADQLQTVRDLFGLGTDDHEYVAVTGQDLVRFLGSGNPNANMLSSALITRRGAGAGITVEILTPANITRVTEIQYANAMITAGVTDALVQVASPVPVTGEAALTGIYRAFYERGVEFDEDRMAVAQEELELATEIADYHENNEEFDTYNLDQALINLKAELADHYAELGQIATPEQVDQIVRDAIAGANLDGVLTEDQLSRLAGFAERFQVTDAIRSEDLRGQLNNLANQVEGLIANIDRGTVMGWWETIRNWFSNLFN